MGCGTGLVAAESASATTPGAGDSTVGRNGIGGNSRE